MIFPLNAETNCSLVISGVKVKGPFVFALRLSKVNLPTVHYCTYLWQIVFLVTSAALKWELRETGLEKDVDPPPSSSLSFSVVNPLYIKS